MGLIKNIISKYERKIKERNEACDKIIIDIESALRDVKSKFSNPQVFIDPSFEEKWLGNNYDLFIAASAENILKLKKSSDYELLVKKQNELISIAKSLQQEIILHNEYAARMKIPKAYSLIGDVEGRKLDIQQMTCIIKEAHNHLVIAGAGTGKTTTVVGKIKYLLESHKCLPEDILVLSFTNASATEMRERIIAETGQNINALTFHKLGLNIITQVNGVVPKITQLNLRQFIKEQLLINMKLDSYLDMLSSYMLYNRVIAKLEFEFNTEEEYKEYLKLNPPTTLKGEEVKSYGEMDIANFLTQNSIKYIYEHPYKIDTQTSEYGQYHPDFYLPDYDIYIEYFGINRKGEVPTFFKAKNNMTAKETYCASMEWKRAIHHDNQTIMIECFAYEKFEGDLLDKLKERLEAESVVLSPISSKELWEKVENSDKSLQEGIIELFETLINLIKSNGYNIEAVRMKNNNGNNIRANNQLLTLLEPIFNSYCQYLSSHNEIDFNDMINLASKYVMQGKYINPYIYVIVDEYQDISKARFMLLHCLRKSRDYDLFCVGDDWQSIYRFTGSDIGYTINFSKYWGAAEISKIETTYRFSQKLIEISGNFIMQNPIQIKKSINGNKDDFGFPLGEISGFNDKFAIEFMSNKLTDVPKDSSVFFIGRYSFDAKMLSDSGLFTYQYNNISGFIDVKSKSRPDLKIIFLTAHKSKGLQADYVFIINNKKSKMGFPSKIQDAPILDLLLDNCDSYPYAEERRLFYVALTRAKKKVYLITVNNQESEFALELKDRYQYEIKREKFECPVCGGQLVKKSGPYGEFLGCSNYRKIGCTYKRKIQQPK